jgi:hypothetical protein
MQQQQHHKIKLVIQVNPKRGVLLYSVDFDRIDNGLDRHPGGTFQSVGEVCGVLREIGLAAEAEKLITAKGPCELVFEIVETKDAMNALGFETEH